MKTRKYKKHYINHKKTIKRKKIKQLLKKRTKKNYKNNKKNTTKKINKHRFIIGGTGKKKHPTRNATPGEMRKPPGEINKPVGVKQVPVNPDIANQKQGNLRHGDTSYEPFPTIKLDDRPINFSSGQEGVPYDGKPLPTMPNILNPKYAEIPRQYTEPTREGQPGDMREMPGMNTVSVNQEILNTKQGNLRNGIVQETKYADAPDPYLQPTREGRPGDMRETPGVKQVPVNPDIHGNLRGTEGKPATLFSWTSSFVTKTVYTAGAMAAGTLALGLGPEIAFSSFLFASVSDQISSNFDAAKIAQILTPVARTAYAAGVSAEDINKAVNDILQQKDPSFAKKWNFDISKINGAMRMGTTNFVKHGDVITDLGFFEEMISMANAGVVVTHMNNFLHEVPIEQQKQNANEIPAQSAQQSPPMTSFNSLKASISSTGEPILQDIINSLPTTDAEADLVNDNIQIIVESLQNIREKRHNEKVNEKMSTMTNKQSENEWLKNSVGDKISAHNTKADTNVAIEEAMTLREKLQNEQREIVENRLNAHDIRVKTNAAIENALTLVERLQNEQREIVENKLSTHEARINANAAIEDAMTLREKLQNEQREIVGSRLNAHKTRVNANAAIEEALTLVQQLQNTQREIAANRMSAHKTRVDTNAAIEKEMSFRQEYQNAQRENASNRISTHNTRADTIGTIESEMPQSIRLQNERQEYAANRISERQAQSDMDIILSNQAAQDYADAVKAASGRIARRNAVSETKMRARNARLQAFAEVIAEQYAQDSIPEYTNKPTPKKNKYNPRPGEYYRKAKEEFIKTTIMKQNNSIQRVDEKTALDNTVYLTSILGAYVFRCITKKIAAGKKKHSKNYNRQRELQIMHGENVVPPQIQSYLRRGEIPMEYTQGNALANLDQYRRGNYSFVSNEGWMDEPLQLQVPLDEGAHVTRETTPEAPRTRQPIRAIGPATPALSLATPRTLIPQMIPSTPQTPMPVIGNAMPPMPETQITTTQALPTSMPVIVPHVIEQPLPLMETQMETPRNERPRPVIESPRPVIVEPQVKDITMTTANAEEDEEDEEDELEPVDMFIEAVKTEVTSRKLVKGDAIFKEQIKRKIDELTNMANDDENDVINNRIQNLGVNAAFNNGIITVIERYPNNVNEELKSFIIQFLDTLLITFRSDYNNDNEEDEEDNERVIYNREKEDESYVRNERNENMNRIGIQNNPINVNVTNRSIK